MTKRQQAAAGGRGPQGRQGGLSLVPGGAGAGSLGARLARLGDRGRRRGGSQAESQAGSPGIWSSNPVLLAALVSVLCVIGLVMVLSASSVESLAQHGSSWYVFEHQVVWEALGTGLLVAASRVDYHRYRRLAVPFLLVCLVLLVAVLVPSLGKTVSGSTRWLGVGPLRLQPSELAKAALVLFGADVLARRTGRDRRWGPAVRPVLIVTAVIALLVLAQPDMGTALILGAIAMGLLCAAGAPKRVIGGVVGVGVVAGFLVAVAKPYRRARLLSFLDPWVHRHNSGYQVVQSLVGFANGHLFGVGLGASRAKWGFLPNAHTDFIFTIIGEELGLLGSLLVLALFVALAVVGMRVAARAPDRYGSLVATGVTCWLIAQAVLNMGAVIGLLPVTGIPLPFVSYGGSSLVIDMASAGILLNIARQPAPRVAPARAGPSRVAVGAPRRRAGGGARAREEVRSGAQGGRGR